MSCVLFYFNNLVILVTLVCLVVAAVSAALAAMLSCRVRCPYYCIRRPSHHPQMSSAISITEKFIRKTVKNLPTGLANII